MKKSIIFILCVFLLSTSALCQFNVVSESNKFSEPGGRSFIVQLKNGNTVFININSKTGISARAYDADHVQKGATSFFPATTLKSLWIENCFEVNADVALFISALDGKKAILDRFIIDGNTGQLKNESLVISAEGKAKELDLGSNTSFYVEKSYTDESYSIALFNQSQNDKNKRIQLIQFNRYNQEIHSAMIVPDDNEEFKYFVVMNILVVDSNRTYLALYNGTKKYLYDSKKKGRFLMASVNMKSPAVEFTDLNLPAGVIFGHVMSCYSPAVKKIFMILAEPKDDDKPVPQHFVKFDVDAKTSMIKPFFSVSDELNKKAREKYSNKSNYFGTLDEFMLNNDQTLTAVYEETINYSFHGASTSYSGKILVANYDANGETLSTYIIPKLFMTDGYSEYKKYLLVGAGKNKYMCINDTRRNNDVKGDKFIELVGVADADAFYYPLNGSDPFPKRAYVFGEKKDIRELCGFKVSDYDSKRNLLAILKLTKTNSSAEVSIVWMKPQ